MNLLPGDGVTLAATFVQQCFAPTHGYFKIDGNDLSFVAPYSAIEDVELPPLKIGDRVVTSDGKRGTVVDFFDDRRLALIDLGVDGWGEMIRPIFVRINTLVRAD